MKKSVLTFAAALAVGVGCFQARGVVVMGNIPGSPTDPFNKFVSTTTWQAVSFTMGLDSYSMDNAKVRLTGYTTDTPAIAIFSDSSGNPGTQVSNGLLTNPGGNAGGAATFTFTASGLTLSASTTYWLVVKESSGNMNWTRENPQVTPSGVATFGSYKSSSNSGTTWAAQSEKLTFEVNGTLVPEPHEWAMVAGLGLLGFGLVRRRAAAKTA